MSRPTEYFAAVVSTGAAMVGVGMLAGTRAVRARPPCSWGLIFVHQVGDSRSDSGCLVLLKEMAGRQQHGGVHRQRVLNRAAAVVSEHAVTLSPHHLSGVGPRMEPFVEEVLLRPGQLESAHDLQERVAAIAALH